MPEINITTVINRLHTPAFMYDQSSILRSIRLLTTFRNRSNCKILFPLKSFSSIDALDLIGSYVYGFSASSLFEARLARHILGEHKAVHITTPGFRSEEIDEIFALCDYVSFNSLSQFGRYYNEVKNQTSCGLRINTQLPFVKDNRYNPCRKSSKLGAPLDQLSSCLRNEPKTLDKIEGVHFHTNCESKNFNELYKTVRYLEANLPALLNKIDWINLGGGYLFDSAEDLNPLIKTVSLLKNKYDLEVFFEPGKAIVGGAGYIVSTVLDLFESDGKKIAVLDTTVNHMPEVFEYQFEPDVIGRVDDGEYSYILAGCTCLAGDIFGEYSFLEPLEIGSRVIFENVGAYTLVKAHTFNGVNLPDIYALTEGGELELKKRFTYEDFLSKCGGENHANKRKTANYSSR